MPSLPSPSNIINKLVEPLTEREFEELPDKQCAICKDTAERPARLSCRCNSIFCNICLRLALATNNDSCPFCRTVEPPVVSLQQYTKQIATQARQQPKVPKKVLKQIWISSMLESTLHMWNIALLTALVIAMILLNRTSDQDIVLLIKLLIVANLQLLAQALYQIRQTSPSLGKLASRQGKAQLMPDHPIALSICMLSATVAVWCSVSSVYLGVSALSAAWKTQGMLSMLRLLNLSRDQLALAALQDMVADLIVRACFALCGIYSYQLTILEMQDGPGKR